MCPKEIILVRLLNSDLSESRARETALHVEGCATCGVRYARLHDAWDVLGRWEVAPPTSETALRDRILGAAATEGRDRAAPPAMARPSWLRVAASVVVATGAGVAAALVVTPSEPGTGRAADVGQEQVVHVLGLEALGGQSGLAAVFEHDVAIEDAEAVGEEQS